MAIHHKTRIASPNKIFLILSLFLLFFNLSFVIINHQQAKRTLEKNVQVYNDQIQARFFQALTATEDRMVQLATYVAADTVIQQLFLQGRRAAEAETGLTKTPKTDLVRQELYNRIRYSRQALAQRYDFRQLHFHLPPGSNSFLRVHQPDKYGDNMDSVRHTIVATNRDRSVSKGFETGRVYSGIRGVVPVFAWDSARNERVFVGALEAGTSFQQTLESIASDSLGIAIFLNEAHMRANVWPDFLAEQTRDNPIINGHFLESTTHTLAREVMAQPCLEEGWSGRYPDFIQILDGEAWVLSSFPLRDFLGTVDPSRAPIGKVVYWYRATDWIETFKASNKMNAFLAVIAFLIMELILYLAIRLIIRKLNQVIEDQKREILDLLEARDRTIQELKTTVETRDKLFSIVSHDLRGPISTQLSFIELINQDFESFELEELKETFFNLELSLRKLHSLAENLLSWSKAQSGKIEAQPRQIDLIDLCNAMLQDCQDQATAKRIQIVVEAEADVSAYCDPDLVTIAIRNLISNAIKFSHVESSIRIKLRMEDDETVVVIQDQGVGIPTEYLKDIFSPTNRFRQIGTAGEPSSGLGLLLVKEYVELNGGTISVESILNEGTSFRLRLPRRH